MTNPEDRNDPWKESLNCYESLADEVNIVGEDWPHEFDWGIFNKIYQAGFDKCETDWVMRMDLDYFIHENDINVIKESMERYSDSPAIVLPQFQFFTYDRYQIKTKLCLILNKKRFPEIKLDGGTDRMLATLNGEILTYKNVPQIKVPIWQYDSMFRTKEIIGKDRARFARAWRRTFDDFGDRGGDDPDIAFDAWFNMIKSRYKKHLFNKKLENHPIYILKKLEGLQNDQFGYSAFDLKDNIKLDYRELPREIKKKYF